MIVQADLESRCSKFHATGCMPWFITSFCLESCIWLDAISGWIPQRNSIKFCADLEKWATETLAMIRQTFSKKKASAVHGKFNSPRTKKAKQVKSKVKGDCSQIIRPSRPNNQFRLLLWLLRRVRENVRRLRPELWGQKNWLLHHDSAPSHTSFFHQGIF
jgi:hypothetical protein